MIKKIYYEDELNDEFSNKKITPIKIDEKYKYEHGVVWNLASVLMQNILSMPIKLLYTKLKFNLKIVGKEKFKECKNTGYIIYANHTQEIADTIIPSLANYPKRNFFIVNPENVSMKGLKTITKLLGAIPIFSDKKSAKNFLNMVKKTLNNKNSITIYPEAHIWPYCTFIRNFESVSFKYPYEYNVPFYVITNTYHKRERENKIKIISYVDGPFYPDLSSNKAFEKKRLRNIAYNKMTERSKLSSYSHIIYERKKK